MLTLLEPTAAKAGGVAEGVTELLDAVAVGQGQSLPCWSVPADAFFAEAPAEIEAAKALCADCPVQTQCLAGALTRREPCGVWGGQFFVAGQIVARKRPRGRPRKDGLEAALPERLPEQLREEQPVEVFVSAA